jgi:hypothetical protein
MKYVPRHVLKKKKEGRGAGPRPLALVATCVCTRVFLGLVVGAKARLALMRNRDYMI